MQSPVVRIFVDADSCPRLIRSVLIKAAIKRGAHLVMVANRTIPAPDHQNIEKVIVEAGDQKADRYICDHVRNNDLCVTRDIPLAAECLELGARVLNDRGEVFSRENIRERLSMRDAMKEFREIGLYESPDANFGQRELKAFSDCFDREFTKLESEIVLG